MSSANRSKLPYIILPANVQVSTYPLQINVRRVAMVLKMASSCHHVRGARSLCIAEKIASVRTGKEGTKNAALKNSKALKAASYGRCFGLEGTTKWPLFQVND
mmetsp:Transcript_1461/g.3097  ORF Transcript_1461/g.3097 Transcript_1461/m.3097 type:complete len:103 (+) Transcript_1461:72-380(+)